MKNLKNILYLFPLALAVSCAPEFDDLPASTAGSADFSNYVAVGNSLTAGYQSNALSANGQLNSFPAIIAEQMKIADPNAVHNIPLLTGAYGENGVGISGAATAVDLVVSELALEFVTDCRGNQSLGPALKVKTPYPSFSGFLGSSNATPGPYNNYGVPGAKSFHLGAPGYGNAANLLTGAANPYYVRFTNPTDPNEAVINAAAAANPSFFSLWIGNNDILSYATSGGSGTDNNATGNTNPLTYGGNDITHNATFAATYDQLVGALIANGAKGVVTNIPDVTSIPYFTTIGYNSLVLDKASADALNAAYAVYNQGIQNALQANAITQQQADLKTINFVEGNNRYIVDDSPGRAIPGTGLPNIRHATFEDLIVLTTPGDSLRCAGWGTSKGIPRNFTLDSDERAAISNATASYNATIKAAADNNNLAFVDANAILKDMTKGLAFDGVTYSTTFVTGGAFSLDGVHPNTVGYAIIANAHIDAINAKYGSNIPRVSVNDYEGIVFP